MADRGNGLNTQQHTAETVTRKSAHKQSTQTVRANKSHSEQTQTQRQRHTPHNGTAVRLSFFLLFFFVLFLLSLWIVLFADFAEAFDHVRLLAHERVLNPKRQCAAQIAVQQQRHTRLPRTHRPQHPSAHVDVRPHTARP
eukprot:EW704865.1.p1 GENE.EW704865.1~~EW704865.1.p1  ORF type:complete len:140 (-),score=39.28 EW704865.1:3-422(-)